MAKQPQKVSRKSDGTFAKGTAACNPGGRTKKSKEIEKAAQQILTNPDGSNRALVFLASVMDDTDEAAKDRMKAAELLLAYGYGQPAQRLKLSNDADATGQILPLKLSA